MGADGAADGGVGTSGGSGVGGSAVPGHSRRRCTEPAEAVAHETHTLPPATATLRLARLTSVPVDVAILVTTPAADTWYSCHCDALVRLLVGK